MIVLLRMRGTRERIGVIDRSTGGAASSTPADVWRRSPARRIIALARYWAGPCSAANTPPAAAPATNRTSVKWRRIARNIRPAGIVVFRPIGSRGPAGGPGRKSLIRVAGSDESLGIIRI